jgi:hypothetical protein
VAILIAAECGTGLGTGREGAPGSEVVEQHRRRSGEHRVDGRQRLGEQAGPQQQGGRGGAGVQQRQAADVQGRAGVPGRAASRVGPAGAAGLVGSAGPAGAAGLPGAAGSSTPRPSWTFKRQAVVEPSASTSRKAAVAVTSTG